ncbi:hypothetical protein MUY27_04990 [Mucilaginibacter sp. RS28]|uniref:Uncharacterized protein n=1 Tax=Mucilaginibacter straminoryzae TaxID=2932774 RepID=A0A9X2B7X4_9SPHI|nr:hypothetical protein [Mucilaginibacter straminoryzae]MCJ8209054.1 hypothetical protein [Mucilaginibacter straminoryzae]
MTISKKTKRPLVKEFEAIDIMPYGYSLLLVGGSIYLLHQFIHLIPGY